MDLDVDRLRLLRPGDSAGTPRRRRGTDPGQLAAAASLRGEDVVGGAVVIAVDCRFAGAGPGTAHRTVARPRPARHGDRRPAPAGQCGARASRRPRSPGPRTGPSGPGVGPPARTRPARRHRLARPRRGRDRRRPSPRRRSAPAGRTVRARRARAGTSRAKQPATDRHRPASAPPCRASRPGRGGAWRRAAGSGRCRRRHERQPRAAPRPPAADQPGVVRA